MTDTERERLLLLITRELATDSQRTVLEEFSSWFEPEKGT